MDAPFTAIETTGIIDEHQQLRLDESLPVSGPKRVRVIVLYPMNGYRRARNSDGST